MSVQPKTSITSNFSIDPDHVEQITRSISALTIDPIKNIFYYVFPFMGAFSSNYIELRENDPTQAAMMPEPAKSKVFTEVKELTRCAGITRKVIPFTSLNYHFSTCGGSLSLTNPALFMPHQHIFRTVKSPFGFESPKDGFSHDLWNYSDNETRFLIARELGHIKGNNGLIRIAIKVSILASLFTIFAGPIGWIATIGLVVGAIGLYIVAERSFEGRMDIVGAEILGKRIDNEPLAFQTAIATLDKMRRQNLCRREQSPLARLYITQSGNNLLDVSHQFITTRIAHLQARISRLSQAHLHSFSPITII